MKNIVIVFICILVFSSANAQSADTMILDRILQSMKNYESRYNCRDMFSCRGGLLFTFEDDKTAKTTFGIIASLTDIPYNDLTAKDRFSVSFRIGIPFKY